MEEKSARRLKPGLVLTLLILLAVAAIGAVVGEFQLTRHVSAMTIAPALMFVSFLMLYPILGGLQANADGGRRLTACQSCGSLWKVVPRVAFCIRCGAFPKARRNAA
ncbi:MAG: hypothetical protein V4510_02925 [bacterium]